MDSSPSPATDHRSQITDHRSQITVHSSQFTVHSSQFTVHSSHFTPRLFTSHFMLHTSHLHMYTFAIKVAACGVERECVMAAALEMCHAIDLVYVVLEQPQPCLNGKCTRKADLCVCMLCKLYMPCIAISQGVHAAQRTVASPHSCICTSSSASIACPVAWMAMSSASRLTAAWTMEYEVRTKK